MRPIRVIIVLVLLSLPLTGQTKSSDCDSDSRIAIKYLVTEDSHRHDRTRHDRVQELWIFLDPRDFSEEKLRALFGHLTKKYTSAPDLRIWVETSWDTIPAPNDSDCEGDAISGSAGSKREYHRAFFTRQGGTESFSFNLDLTKNATVVILKGSRP